MFYGWQIVGVTFVAQLVATGTIFYSFGFLFLPILEDLGLTRTQLSVPLVLVAVTASAVGPWIGSVVDRGNARRVMVIGALVHSAGFALLSQVQSYSQLLVVYALPLALGMALLGGVVNPTLVARWFVARRGRALGLSMMGVSFGGVLMPHVITALISSVGWRGAALALSLLPVGVVLPLVLWRVVDRPLDHGLQPDGVAETPSAVPGTTLPGTAESATEVPGNAGPGNAGQVPGTTEGPVPGTTEGATGPVPGTTEAAGPAPSNGLLDLVRVPAFWVVAIVFSLGFAPNSAVVGQLAPHAEGLGFDAAQAADAVSVMALLGMVGKPFFGWIGDRFGGRRTLALCLALQAGGLMLVLSPGSHAMLLLGAGVFGAGFSGLMPLHGLIAANVFGAAFVGRVLGAMGPVMMPITQGSGVYMAAVHDRTGSYDIALYGLVALLALAVALVPAIRRSRGS